MKYRVAGIFILFALISMTAGWMRAGFSTSNVLGDVDNWEQLNESQGKAIDYAVISRRLKSSDIFPISREEAKAIETRAEFEQGDEEKTVALFPKILGASVLNGVPHVHLLLPENTLLKAKSGDVLENGWELKSVDLRRVIAVYDNEEQEFSVTDYDIQSVGGKSGGAKTNN